MEKIVEIQTFVQKVMAALGEGRAKVSDHWDGDLSAIGIESLKVPGMLAYVAYSNTSGQYFVELEKASKDPTSFPYDVVSSVDGLSEEEAILSVLDHLK